MCITIRLIFLFLTEITVVLGTTLTNQNYIEEEIKSRLKSGNACCHSVQILFSSSLLSKNVKRKICRLSCMVVKLGRSH